MKTLKENQKVSLSVGQLRHLIKEARPATTTQRSTSRCESTEIDIYPEVTDTQSKCPDLNAGYDAQFVAGEERYIVLLDLLGETGALWGPFTTFEEAEDVLFSMAAAFRDDGRLVAYTKSSLTFTDKYDGAEACMYIVPGSLNGRFDAF